MMHLVCAASSHNGRGLGTTLPAPAVSATYGRERAMHNSDVCVYVYICIYICVCVYVHPVDVWGGFPYSVVEYCLVRDRIR